MNATAINSPEVIARFAVTVVPLRFARTLMDVGQPRVGKLVAMGRIALTIALKCVIGRPALVYYSLAPTGWAFVRDLCLIAILKIGHLRAVYHIHGSGIDETVRPSVVRIVTRWALSRAIVIALSPTLAGQLSTVVAQTRVRVLANGVEECGGRGEWSRREDNGVGVLFLSNMIPEKGVFVLLEALGMLVRRGIAFSAVFAGPALDKEFALTFRDMCERYQLSGRARWIGPCHGAEKSRAFREASIFAFPTYYGPEGVPLVLLEAMACSLAIVAANQGGIRDVVLDGVTGLLVPPRDARAFAASLEALLVDAELRREMQRAARVEYLSRFTKAHFEVGLAQILDEASNDKGPRPALTNVPA